LQKYPHPEWRLQSLPAYNFDRVDWRKWRAVVFLDPFGMQVPWKTIAALAQTAAIEVFLNFPVGMSIQRLLKRSGDLL
jgi:three-Cys-motif partner protein